jgi:long-subunit fatty acid transport protein
LYIGVNLNAHFSNYLQSTSFFESNKNALNSDYTVKRMNFENNLQTIGIGFSLQIGAIAKVTSAIRLGAAYESPTWYNLTDEFSQNLFAVRANNTEELAGTTVDPKITNFYQPYKLSTPAKLTGSLAYIFGKMGLISFDYAYKDYATTQFRPQNDSYFRNINIEMSTIFAVSHEFRFGAEYKIKEWSLRSGYRFEGSLYKNKTTIGDLKSFSAGLGYNFGATKLDLSYMIAQRDSQLGFFSHGLTDGAKINTINNNLSLTLLFEL